MTLWLRALRCDWRLTGGKEYGGPVHLHLFSGTLVWRPNYGDTLFLYGNAAYIDRIFILLKCAIRA